MFPGMLRPRDHFWFRSWFRFRSNWSQSRPRSHEVLISVSYILVSCVVSNRSFTSSSVMTSDCVLCSVNIHIWSLWIFYSHKNRHCHYHRLFTVYYFKCVTDNKASRFVLLFTCNWIDHTGHLCLGLVAFGLGLITAFWSRSRSRPWSQYVLVSLTSLYVSSSIPDEPRLLTA